MNCPYCGRQESRVIDSRSLDEVVRRRRKCLACNARFTTYERIQPHDIFVIKKWFGRTRSNKLVFFEDAGDWLGQLAIIQIEKTSPWSLRGEVKK